MKTVRFIGNIVFILLILTMFGSFINYKTNGKGIEVFLIILAGLVVFFVFITIYKSVSFAAYTVKNYYKQIIELKGLMFLYLIWFISLFVPVAINILRDPYLFETIIYCYTPFFILWYASKVTNNCIERCKGKELYLKFEDFVVDTRTSIERIR